MPNRPITLIAAVARNGVIGRNNVMPWHLPGDMAHFRRSTMGRPVILGRKTIEAIGGPLPGRFPVVISHDRNFHAPGAELVHDVPTAVSLAEAIARREGAAEIMVAGGATIYAALMSQATTLLITAVDLSPEGDATFPLIDPAIWRVAEQRPAQSRQGGEAAYTFLRYVRRGRERLDRA